LASELDLKRALAEAERNRQAVEDADYTAVTLRRSLGTLSGLAPEGDPVNDAPALPLDDLREEPPLPAWVGSVEQLPSVRAAAADEHAAKHTAASSQAALYPTVTGQFTEVTAARIGVIDLPS
jgi:outer membrane protein TolC